MGTACHLTAIPSPLSLHLALPFHATTLCTKPTSLCTFIGSKLPLLEILVCHQPPCQKQHWDRTHKTVHIGLELPGLPPDSLLILSHFPLGNPVQERSALRQAVTTRCNDDFDNYIGYLCGFFFGIFYHNSSWDIYFFFNDLLLNKQRQPTKAPFLPEIPSLPENMSHHQGFILHSTQQGEV